MNSDQLIEVSNAIAAINETLATAILATDSETRDMSIRVARQELAVLQKEILEHATADFTKDLDV